MPFLYIWLILIGHIMHIQFFTNLEEKKCFLNFMLCVLQGFVQGMGKVSAKGLQVHDLHINGP